MSKSYKYIISLQPEKSACARVPDPIHEKFVYCCHSDRRRCRFAVSMERCSFVHKNIRNHNHKLSVTHKWYISLGGYAWRCVCVCVSSSSPPLICLFYVLFMKQIHITLHLIHKRHHWTWSKSEKWRNLSTRALWR